MTLVELKYASDQPISVLISFSCRLLSSFRDEQVFFLSKIGEKV